MDHRRIKPGSLVYEGMAANKVTAVRKGWKGDHSKDFGAAAGNCGGRFLYNDTLLDFDHLHASAESVRSLELC